MPSRTSAGGVSRLALVPVLLLAAFLLTHAFGMLPASIGNDAARWTAMIGFGYATVLFGLAGSAFWCALCAAMAVALNPVYPLPLGELLRGARILGGCIAAAAVIRSW